MSGSFRKVGEWLECRVCGTVYADEPSECPVCAAQRRNAAVLDRNGGWSTPVTWKPIS